MLSAFSRNRKPETMGGGLLVFETVCSLEYLDYQRIETGYSI
jgi:hypothetical protein